MQRVWKLNAEVEHDAEKLFRQGANARWISFKLRKDSTYNHRQLLKAEIKRNVFKLKREPTTSDTRKITKLRTECSIYLVNWIWICFKKTSWTKQAHSGFYSLCLRNWNNANSCSITQTSWGSILKRNLQVLITKCYNANPETRN